MDILQSLVGEGHSCTQNVQGLERVMCITGGTVLLATGIHNGGLLGVLRAIFGGVILARGVVGHCPAKEIIVERQQELLAVKEKIRELTEQLATLSKKSSAT